MCALVPHVPIFINYYHEPVYVTYFGWDVDFQMELTFEKICLTPWSLTQKLRYSVSVSLRNDLSAFTFKHTYVSFCSIFPS